MNSLKTPIYIRKSGGFPAGYTLFFLFWFKNIGCGYSLEPPHQEGSNEHAQSMFEEKNEE